MSDSIATASPAIAAEAERRRADLSATAANLRFKLKPGNLFDEAKGALRAEAGSLADSGRKAVAGHPVAALLAAAGAAVVIGTSMSKKAKTTMDMRGLGAASDGRPPAPTLRGRVAEALGALAQTSFDLAHDRYAQKAQALQNAAKAHVRNLTEEVLAAGEGAIAAMLSALVGKLKPDADERRPKP